MICVPTKQMENDLKDFHQNVLSFETQYERDESWMEALQEAVTIVFDHFETAITMNMPSAFSLIDKRRNVDSGNCHLIPSNSDDIMRNQDSFASQLESCIEKYVKEKCLHPSTSIPRGTEGIASSPSRPSVLLSPSISTTLSNRKKDYSKYRHKDSELGNLEWSFAWDILCNRYGWKCLQQKSKLHPYYYIKPEYSHLPIGKVTKELKRDRDYFVHLDELQQYIRYHYKWKGQISREATAEKSKFSSVGDEGIILDFESEVRTNSKIKRVKNDGRQDIKEKMTKVQIKAEKEIQKKETLEESISSSVDDESTILDLESKLTTSSKRKRVGGKGYRDTKKKMTNVQIKAEKDMPTEKVKVISLSKPLTPSTFDNEQATTSKTYHDTKMKETRIRVATETKHDESQVNIGVKPINEECEDNNVTLSLNDKLQKCMEVLSPTFLPKTVIYDGDATQSIFSSNTRKISFFLQERLDSYFGENKGKSSLMYVCGTPGTGKTSIINNCVKHVAEVWDASDNGSSTLQCEFINAAHISSPQQILHKIAGSVDNKPLDIKKVELSLLQTKKNRKHPPVILILDEIDLLLVGKNNRIQTAKGEEPFLKTLFRWASDPQSKFILIGISNSVGNRNAKRLDKLGKFDEEIVFQAYAEEELTQITLKRLRLCANLIDESTVRYLALKVAKMNGDARLMLQIMSLSFTNYKQEMTDSELGQREVKSVVKLRHVMKALRDLGQVPYEAVIAALPQKAKEVLCVAITLTQVSSLWSVMTLSQLKKYCGEATRHEIMDSLNIDSLIDIVRILEDSGLLRIGDGNSKFGEQYIEPPLWPLRLNVQLEDVERALEKSLLQIPFYKNMVNYVREHNKDRHYN